MHYVIDGVRVDGPFLWKLLTGITAMVVRSWAYWFDVLLVRAPNRGGLTASDGRCLAR